MKTICLSPGAGCFEWFSLGLYHESCREFIKALRCFIRHFHISHDVKTVNEALFRIQKELFFVNLPRNIPYYKNSSLYKASQKRICSGKQPLLSIMLPVYEPPSEYFVPLLKTIVEEVTRNNIDAQIEIVDNASSQVNVYAMIEQLGLSKIVSFHKNDTNVGALANFKICVERAYGHWVHVMPQDDIITQGIYRRFLEIIEKSKMADVIFFNLKSVDNDGVASDILPIFPGALPSGFIEKRYNILSYFYSKFTYPSIIVKKSVHERYGNMTTTMLSQDLEIGIRLLTYTNIWFEPESFVYHRKHSNQLSNNILLLTNHMIVSLGLLRISLPDEVYLYLKVYLIDFLKAQQSVWATAAHYERYEEWGERSINGVLDYCKEILCGRYYHGEAWFFLAMLHQKLGHQESYESCYKLYLEHGVSILDVSKYKKC